jgi:hypothetical protein
MESFLAINKEEVLSFVNLDTDELGGLYAK